MTAAIALLEPASQETILQSYGLAFAQLLEILSEITVVTAVAIFVVMRLPDKSAVTA